jgi:dipeptidyl aminopeptidase/acylaminoacyl peptidase
MPSSNIILRTIAGTVAHKLGCPSGPPCQFPSLAWSPDGSKLAFIVRDGKARVPSVFTVNADGLHPHLLLQNYDGVISALRWSPDGTALSLLAVAHPHKEIGATSAGAALVGDIGALKVADVQRIAVLGTDGSGLKFVSPPDLFIYEYDWQPGGNGFVATGAHGNGDDNWWVARLYAVDRGSGAAREIYKPALQINAPHVSPDGKTVAFIGGIMSDFGSVGGDLYTVPLSGGEATDVTPGAALSVNSLGWFARNDRVLFTALVGDSYALESVSLPSGAMTKRWSAPMSIGGDLATRISLSRDGTAGAFSAQDFEHAPEIFAGPAGSFAAITHDNDAIQSPLHAVSVNWTNDGYHVQGWLLEPRTVAPGKTYPMITSVHGGPSAASTPYFAARGGTVDAIAHGYFVFLPNPRGSFGQGEKFTAANIKDFGYGDLRDILAGIDAAEKVAPIDDKRLGITGFSYGGYMTMWAVTQTNRFKAAVAGAGVADWLSYYGENGIDQWMIPFFGASVYDDPAVYAKSAPMTFIKNVKTPTFVFVGERDVECPAPQSMEFWHALVDLGVPTDLVIYEGEGHGIRQPAHTEDITKRTFAWWAKYLGT